MNTTPTRVDYQERMRRVVAYIHDHLDDPLDLLKLAEIACLSPYHWHRVYHAVQGETIAATVKRLRLHRAAGFLTTGDMTIEEIAKKSGYENLQSFTRIFKSTFGLPPAQYRKYGSHTLYQPMDREGTATMHNVTIKTIPTVAVAAVDHVGDYMASDKAYAALFGCLAQRGLLPKEPRTFGVYYDDPDAVPVDELRSRACCTVTGAVPNAPPVGPAEIAGGRYAVLRHKGPYADLKASYKWLFGEWLVRSGEEAADAPCFEEYLNDARTTPPTELLTDIHLPLK